jgi:hypothetical protein
MKAVKGLMQMNDRAIGAHPPMWVRVMRMTACLGTAGAIAWRGAVYFDAPTSEAIPFLMCQMTAAVLAMLGVLNLCGPEEPGPA